MSARKGEKLVEVMKIGGNLVKSVGFHQNCRKIGLVVVMIQGQVKNGKKIE